MRAVKERLASQDWNQQKGGTDQWNLAPSCRARPAVSETVRQESPRAKTRLAGQLTAADGMKRSVEPGFLQTSRMETASVQAWRASR